ncbi:hypothetical protein EV174_003351 [Coemansia sp. RSA 2320]|nr:hypothetical protein EV174_003351 [Coemansia sp. RSA 2320]
MACRVRLRALLVPVLMLVALATSEQVRLRPEVVPAHGSRVEPATAAPFGRIRRQHIQNAATAGLAAPSATAQARSRAGGNERCHRAILRHPQNCPYIRKHCAGYGDGIFSYVELYYCAYAAWHGTVLLLMTAWLALLFVWLGVSASEYFSPNIGTLARLLRLPESLAGVTLLALGNGAPDLFSTFSAVRAGSGALALGQLIGSASFIISVVVGATTLVAPVYKVSQLSYLRELCFFVATIGMVAVIVLSERLSRGLAICMVGLYIAYVVTVMVTTYYEEQRSTIELPVDCASSLLTGQNERLAEHMIPEPSPLDMRQASESHRAAIQLQLSSVDEEVGLRVPDRPHSNAMSVRVLGDFLQHHPKSLLAAAECSDIINEMRTQQSHHGVQTWPTGTAGCCVSDAGPSNSTSCFTASSTNGQSGAESARADEPDLEMSTEDLRHCADNSNNTSYFYLPLPLNSSERPRTKGDIAAKSPFSLGRCENMMPSPLEIVAAAATHRSTEGHALRGDASPLFIESTQHGLAWVYLIAAEIVSITQALGLMLGLSEEILGLTVVGFGNSLGDLVTNLTLTRMGYPMMAISACFGGPMLCLLIGVGSHE